MGRFMAGVQGWRLVAAQGFTLLALHLHHPAGSVEGYLPLVGASAFGVRPRLPRQWLGECALGQRLLGGEPVARERAGLHSGGMSEQLPRRAASSEDLEEVPPHHVGEILEGELYVSPRPSPLHARAAGRLFQALSAFDKPAGGGDPGGWVILFEPELHLRGEALVPDVAGWRRERLPELPESGALTLAPDWVCEVLSPATEVLDRGRKMGSYAR